MLQPPAAQAVHAAAGWLAGLKLEAKLPHKEVDHCRQSVVAEQGPASGGYTSGQGTVMCTVLHASRQKVEAREMFVSVNLACA